MNIQKVTEGKKRFLDLLLLGDEQESMIDHYLERGEMFVMFTGDAPRPLCVAVVTTESEEVCELKNIAVAPEFQRKGYGSQMIQYLCAHYRQGFQTMLVGTGESVATLTFYQRCGFTYSHTVPDFFIIHYDHPIIEEGKQLKDMIYFARNLKSV